MDSAEKLLTAFSQETVAQQLAGIPIRFAQLTAKVAELRLEGPGEKYIFDILPRLTSSRKVLQPLKGAKKRFIFLSPHIPDAVAAELRSAQVAHADLNGRLFIQTPSLLIDREPKVRLYRNAGPQVKPFVLKSARVSRVLLSDRDREWNQAELEERTGISRALVSLTLAALIERELVTQIRAGNRRAQALYRVNDFARLLDAWVSEDNWRKRVTIEQYSVLAGRLEEVAETARDALGVKNVFFTQWFAAHLRHPHTTPPIVSAYVKRKPVSQIEWGRKVDNGGNFWLILPKDEGVFQESQQVGGFNLVSDVQIYLDLLQVSQRGPEQALALREWEGFAK